MKASCAPIAGDGAPEPDGGVIQRVGGVWISPLQRNTRTLRVVFKLGFSICYNLVKHAYSSANTTSSPGLQLVIVSEDACCELYQLLSDFIAHPENFSVADLEELANFFFNMSTPSGLHPIWF